MDCILIAGEQAYKGELTVWEILSETGEKLKQAHFEERLEFSDKTPFSLRSFVTFKEIGTREIVLEDDDGREYTIVPEDNVSRHPRLIKTVEYLSIPEDLPPLPENPGDPDCTHDLEDDGDRLQICCRKCDYRKNVSFGGFVVEIPFED